MLYSDYRIKCPTCKKMHNASDGYDCPRCWVCDNCGIEQHYRIIPDDIDGFGEVCHECADVINESKLRGVLFR